MENLNLKNQDYEQALEEIMSSMHQMLEQNQQLVAQNEQLAYAVQHPLKTRLNEMQESVRDAVKWCDTKLVEIDDKIMEYAQKIEEAGRSVKSAVVNHADVALTAVQDNYQRAIERLENAKFKIKEFKDNLLSKIKDLASRPAEAWKDGISHIKEFVFNTRAKLNDFMAEVHRDNARGHEESANRIGEFEKAMYIVKQGLSNAIHALKGEPKIDIPYKESKFLKKWQDKLLEQSKAEHDLALKFDYKASANRINAGIESDNREFDDFDVDFGR